ncbi:hypothetical protein C0W93_21020 [Photobacterium leiognathi subsp. mandapamensis]|uniref:Uncharacterized protein n=1 Tax=Photobacterium leiognathi subsp. mandapamensis TaxID=48408 RepID=A0A2T3KPJ6_PHOLD|nr:hypothetical protein C0W93_21020 [Photobacterium leiognathi subsp. mandapamensis]
MLVEKQRISQVIAMKTRGQITAQSIDLHNRYMIDLYLDRQPNQMTDNSHLISTSEQWLAESGI